MKNRDQVIIFRADGGSEIGLGHLIRSAALAEILKEDYACKLVTRCDNKILLDSLKTTFSEIITLPDVEYITEAKAISKIVSPDCLLVLDGYAFDSEYQKHLIKEGFELFCIDDIHSYNFHAKVIINHAGGLNPQIYKALPSTQYFLGPHFALLRNPFLKASLHKRKAILDKNCFICFGGADPSNKTLEILESDLVRTHPDFNHFHVVVGNAFQFKTELQNFVKTQTNITLHYSLSPEEMVSLMQKCSFAICSPSSVVYEYMAIGGVVFIEQIADNQNDIVAFLTNQGLAFKLTELGQIDKERVGNSFIQQAQFFDGKSGERFRKLFRQYFRSKDLEIRKVKSEDVTLCYDWANDPEVRSQSFNQNPISFNDHVNWFNQKLNDPDSFFYILELDGQPIAQIRFQISNNEALISFLASKKIRSQGLGTYILSKGIEDFVKDYRLPVKITGFVKKTNIASQRSFERLAFEKEECKDHNPSFKYSMFNGN